MNAGEGERSKRQKGVRTAQIKEEASYLPAAEVLKEKVQGRSPHHCRGHDAEEW